MAAQPAVLFDLGNVLVRLNMERGLARLRALAGPRASAGLQLQYEQVFLSHSALAFNRGDLGPDAFLDFVRTQLDLAEAPREALAAAWCDIFDLYPEMEALADEVLALGHPAYLASNTDPLHFAHLTPRMPLLGRLTGLHLSYEARLIKPDPDFFRAALARFGLEPQHCAYLDDRPEHVAAARGLGIPSHLHDFAERGVRSARAFLRTQGVPVQA